MVEYPEVQKFSERLLQIIGKKLASALYRSRNNGGQIVIHIAPNIRQVKIEWPPEVEAVKLEE